MQEILPSGGLANFHNEVSKLANLGRYEDAYIVHAAEGETVVPMEVFDSNPGLKEMLFNQMREMGIQPERYIVGSEFNSINPITGQPEFFLKKIFKEAKKALKKVAPYAGMIAGVAGLGPGYAALIGAGVPLLAGQGAGEALMGGLGGYGAGKAFGTAKYASGLPGANFLAPSEGIFAGGDYIFGSKTPFKQLGANLGFGDGSDQQLSKAIETKALPEGTTLENITPDQLTRLKDLQKTGLLPDPSQAITSLSGNQIATVAALGVPIYQALKAEQDNPTGMTMEDITGKYPWYGEFGTTQAIDPITGNPMGMAEGGIVQHFQAGTGPFGAYYPEETDYDASQVINESGVVDPTEDLDLFLGDDMAANELADQEGVMQVAGLNEMLTVYDNVEQRVVTITRAEFARNPGRYSMAPPTEDSVPAPMSTGLQDEFDKVGLKEFVAGAGVTGARAGAAANEFFAGAAENMKDQEGYQFGFQVDEDPYRRYGFDEPGITDEARLEFLDREGIIDQSVLFDIARSIKPTGRLNMDDIQRVKELIMNNMEAFKLAKERKSSGRLNIDDIMRAKEMLSGIGTGTVSGAAGTMNTLAMQIAKARKPSGRINEDDIERAMADIASGAITPHMLARLMKTAGRINEDDIERAQEILNSVQDYLGPRSEMGVEEQGDLGLRDGGIAYLAEGSFPRRTGAIAGPGCPKDDRVPAMLSDGEFVMTAKAVRNAGGGSRREGAKKMYKLMNRLEGTA